MTTQITVRIGDDLVAFADEQVRAGQAKSRAQVVEGALLREKRRLGGLRDAEIYRKYGEDPDMVALAAYPHPPLDD